MDWKPFFIQRWLEQVRMKTFLQEISKKIVKFCYNLRIQKELQKVVYFKSFQSIEKKSSHCQDFQKHHQSFSSLMKQIFIFK
jgi:hypothetical protein